MGGGIDQRRGPAGQQDLGIARSAGSGVGPGKRTLVEQLDVQPPAARPQSSASPMMRLPQRSRRAGTSIA